ncbi:MAG: ATP-binding protein [Pseudomonadota bacterium]
MAKRTWLWWSSGKDSAWALHTMKRNPQYQVEALVTSVNVDAQRVAMHAVRESLLKAQCDALGLPLRRVPIPYPCPNGAYEAAAAEVIAEAEEVGVTHMAFGDLFLEDIRAYREQLLESSPIEPVFPLWRSDTRILAETMISGGVEAFLTCIDPRALDPSFVGRSFDRKLLEDLPPGVDPCGENGEFHTFVSHSPDYSAPVPVAVGERVERDGFWFADLKEKPGTS